MGAGLGVGELTGTATRDGGSGRTSAAAGPTTDATIRTAMIEAALRQLAGSLDHDVATRAVCEAVGVTQPVLYRLIGDQLGPLDAAPGRDDTT
ncbi:hypothetical protein [Streptomyces sp. NPDC001422]|uniref:hypothetical protein n=1 Tax=Streptomyces sp. NPDC001422 TaxID=3364575 RepID=UPI00369E8D74